MLDNPLLSIRFHIPFDQVQAEHVEPAIAELLRRAQESIDEIARDTAPRTFENTMLALERSTENLDYALGVVRHLESVNTTPELRAAWNAVEPQASAFYSGIPLNEGSGSNCRPTRRQAKRKPSQAPGFASSPKRSIRSAAMARNSIPAGKKRMADIDVELTKVTTKFSENVLDSTNAFELIVEDEAKLAGLPPSAIAAARQSFESKNPDAKGTDPKDKPGWRFTLQGPSYMPVLTYLDDRDIREKMYRAYSARATEPERDNRPVLARILELRREKATLLGFPGLCPILCSTTAWRIRVSAQSGSSKT